MDKEVSVEELEALQAKAIEYEKILKKIKINLKYVILSIKKPKKLKMIKKIK